MKSLNELSGLFVVTFSSLESAKSPTSVLSKVGGETKFARSPSPEAILYFKDEPSAVKAMTQIIKDTKANEDKVLVRKAIEVIWNGYKVTGLNTVNETKDSYFYKMFSSGDCYKDLDEAKYESATFESSSTSDGLGGIKRAYRSAFRHVYIANYNHAIVKKQAEANKLDLTALEAQVIESVNNPKPKKFPKSK